MRRSLVLAVVVSSALALPVPSFAAPPARGDLVVTHPRDVSGASRYAGRHCNVPSSFYLGPGGREGEPTIAVDPARPARRYVAWMDRTRASVDGAYTLDGGRSWRKSLPRGLDECTGNHSAAWEATGDVWASYGPDGTLYLSSLTWAHYSNPPYRWYRSVVRVAASRDGGRTWSAPRTVSAPDGVADKDMVLADPHRPGVVYLVWRNANFGLPVPPARGGSRLLFARSTDSGRTWTRPIPVAHTAADIIYGTPQLAVLRGGDLVYTSAVPNTGGSRWQVVAYRSTDHGRTWSRPAVVRTVAADLPAPTACGAPVTGTDNLLTLDNLVATGPRSLAMVGLDSPADTARHGGLVLSRSGNGGRTWHSTVLFRSPFPLALPDVAAGSHGRLALVWDQYLLPRADCRHGVVPARTLVAVAAGGGRWSQATVGATWNLADTNTGGTDNPGDYQSIAAAGRGFTVAAPQGRVLGAYGPDVIGRSGIVVANVWSTP